MHHIGARTVLGEKALKIFRSSEQVSATVRVEHAYGTHDTSEEERA
jgi:hypothetical protein